MTNCYVKKYPLREPSYENHEPNQLFELTKDGSPYLAINYLVSLNEIKKCVFKFAERCGLLEVDNDRFITLDVYKFKELCIDEYICPQKENAHYCDTITCKKVKGELDISKLVFLHN